MAEKSNKISKKRKADVRWRRMAGVWHLGDRTGAPFATVEPAGRLWRWRPGRAGPLSEPANLTRAKDAAQSWVERGRPGKGVAPAQRRDRVRSRAKPAPAQAPPPAAPASPSARLPGRFTMGSIFAPRGANPTARAAWRTQHEARVAAEHDAHVGSRAADLAAGLAGHHLDE